MSDFASLLMLFMLASFAFPHFVELKSDLARHRLAMLNAVFYTAFLMSFYYELPFPTFIGPAAGRTIGLAVLILFGLFAICIFIRDFRAASRKRAQTSVN